MVKIVNNVQTDSTIAKRPLLVVERVGPAGAGKTTLSQALSRRSESSLVGWEGLPSVLIEAVFCGPPIIATDCPSDPREILSDGKYGQLVPVGDMEALSQTLET